jgi:hypothetical protein
MVEDVARAFGEDGIFLTKIFISSVEKNLWIDDSLFGFGPEEIGCFLTKTEAASCGTTVAEDPGAISTTAAQSAPLAMEYQPAAAPCTGSPPPQSSRCRRGMQQSVDHLLSTPPAAR